MHQELIHPRTGTTLIRWTGEQALSVPESFNVAAAPGGAATMLKVDRLMDIKELFREGHRRERSVG